VAGDDASVVDDVDTVEEVDSGEVVASEDTCVVEESLGFCVSCWVCGLFVGSDTSVD